MQKSNRLVSRRLLVFASVVALAGLSASRVHAASVFMWVADGSSVVGYNTSGSAVSGASLSCSGDCFSLATSGTSGTNENLFVADAANHTLSEYSWNGTALTASGPSFSFVADPSAGNISPQEIAFDGNGNVWTTSFDGQIVEYNATTGNSTIVEPANGALFGARGIMINGTTVYVTVDNAYGSGGGVYSFSTSGGSVTLYHSIAAATVGGYEDGQMRGIAVDQGGNIFYADSTWAPAGTNEGYINENTGASAVLKSLAGPNEIQTGQGTAGVESDDSPSCDVLYIADYYSGTAGAPSKVLELATGYSTSGVAGGSCGAFDAQGGTFISNSTADISGIALSPDESSLGGDAVGVGPTFITNAPPPAVPEPGTFALMTGALLLALGIGIRTQRRRRLE
jgi:hypothetical protein